MSLMKDDAVFEGVDSSRHLARSAANELQGFWGSNYFWGFCEGRADLSYLDRWCVHPQARRGFCAANIYPEGEDDSTRDGNSDQQKPNNRKRHNDLQDDTLSLLVRKIDLIIDSETSKIQETWKEQKMFLQEQRAAQKLSTLSTMLAATLEGLLEKRR
ncbi:hypothetical protein GN958_ATG16544 [Phytophthora infestans]|uniref:Uncharacterized protein n=1 Tax=Phytophthora infestans TaxID=4787 RepID=A0A8S9U5V9_PHYIN|nr:hypothetical protein GN958_ATG16544 [Phytophthora infestans]